ncbi:hypothetical protein BT96DRAFT_817584 [Gymnopus androsaceus JB14]|uniref:Uncharacterized protein n=1 Tax=Gymnopus androsaceus JB14 TaxID=1447944 RepID=A0A6A4HWR3_9AGAR|nr:hypothetical protein BT96DRAFT_817584 [Gymnopus androsaceus JB14]
MSPAKYDSYEDAAPPAYTSTAGPSRIPVQGTPVFPSQSVTGPPPCFDLDGVSPVFFGSAHLPDSSIHPCKIAPSLAPSVCRVAYGGREIHHSGPYIILPFIPYTMELVPTSNGQIPKGRRPIEGGYEIRNGREIKLYHAVAKVPLPARGGFTRVPGKAGVHLSGCNVPWGDRERVFRDYEIL